jgi:hypothetical protein
VRLFVRYGGGVESWLDDMRLLLSGA